MASSASVGATPVLASRRLFCRVFAAALCTRRERRVHESADRTHTIDRGTAVVVRAARQVHTSRRRVEPRSDGRDRRGIGGCSGRSETCQASRGARYPGTSERLSQSLRYGEDLRYLDGFKSRFDEYRRLDDEFLPLAVENTNLKAQRLSFGPAREAPSLSGRSIDAAVRTDATKDTCRAEAAAARANMDVLEIQVLTRRISPRPKTPR